MSPHRDDDWWIKPVTAQEAAAICEARLCGECGCIHRPGENTLCPGWRPGPFVPTPAGPQMPEGWTFSPALGGAFVSKREDGGQYALTITLLRALLATQGLSVVPTPQADMLTAVRKVLNDWTTGKFSDRHFGAHKAMRRIQELNDARELAELAKLARREESDG